MNERLGLRVNFFGSFEVIRDGKPIPTKLWPQRKTQSLLKILLHERGDIFTQDQLIDWLFAEQDLDVAVRNLQKRISELRRILEPDLSKGQESKFIKRMGQGYCFIQDSPCSTDLEQFSALTQQGRTRVESGDWLKAREYGEQAIALYRGEFLSEDRYEEWTLQPREHWQEEHLRTLENLAEAHAHLGEYASAIERCRQVMAVDGARERTARQLMLCYWKTGEQSKLSQTFQQLTDGLAELGIEPSSETDQLYEKLLSGDTADLEQIYSAERRSHLEYGDMPAKTRKGGVAVLPFTNMSPDPENEYFSDGLTDELIHALARIKDLQVTSRTSAFALKGQSHSLREIGEKLNVANVVEGSVRKVGNRIRVVAQLIDTNEDAQLWSHRYDFELEDIFQVQDEIAQNIAENLKSQLSKEQSERLTKHYTQNLEAYNLYLKGRFYWNKRSSDDLNQAIGYFAEAINLDANYALAYTGLADSYNILSEYDWISPKETLPKAREAAEKALQIDPNLAEARASLGYSIFYFDWDFEGAEREFKRAIELDPHYPVGRMWYSNFLMAMGRKAESLHQIRLAQASEPLSSLYNACAASMCYFARDYDQSIELGRSTLEREPNFVLANIFLMWSYEKKEMFLEAIHEGERANELLKSPQTVAYLGHAYAQSGDRERAHELIDQLQDMSREMYVSPFCTALIYAGLNDADETFRWLELAFGERAIDIVYLKVWPMFDTVRDDPRFENLLQRIGLAE